MGPGPEGRPVVLGDEAALEAARDEFRRWDIYEVFGGLLAVPAGTVLVRSSTPAGLTGKLRRLEAGEAEP